VAQTLLDRGWTNVRPLAGGFDPWRASGSPTEPKSTSAQTPQEVAANIAKAEGDEAVE